jgi:hypothetical protein
MLTWPRPPPPPQPGNSKPPPVDERGDEDEEEEEVVAAAMLGAGTRTSARWNAKGLLPGREGEELLVEM